MAQYRDVMLNWIQSHKVAHCIHGGSSVDGGGLLEIWWLNGDVAMNGIV